MQCVVVGGGAAGMFAAGLAAENGHTVTLLEAGTRLGTKLALTGGGRCNFTNTSDRFLEHIPRGQNFLRSALARFTPADTIVFFERIGVPCRVEADGRVFPQSEDAAEVVEALKRWLKNVGVAVQYDSNVRDLILEDGAVVGVKTDGAAHKADRVILATGGLSYSKHNGYDLARAAGQPVTTLRPGLVALASPDAICKSCQGISLQGATVRLRAKDGKILREETGDLLFTHFGVSGPAVLNCSSFYEPGARLELTASAIPKRCRPFFPQESITLSISGTAAMKTAMVTCGGVVLDAVNPKTMQSKICEGLFFAGEILDCDGLTGGFNLQIAWSTAYAAVGFVQQRGAFAPCGERPKAPRRSRGTSLLLPFGIPMCG